MRDLVVIVFCLMVGIVSPMLGQPPQPGGEPGRGGPPDSAALAGQAASLAAAECSASSLRDEVQQELQLVDEQKDKVRGIVR